MDLVELMMESMAPRLPGAEPLHLLKFCELYVAEMERNGGDSEATSTTIQAALVVEASVGTPWAVNILAASEAANK